MEFNWQRFLIVKGREGNTQCAIANRLGVDRALVCMLLSGRRQFTWETKRRMALAWDSLWGPLMKELMEDWRNGDGLA